MFIAEVGWTFLTNHGHVLVCLANDPEVLLRDVATSIGITERAVQQIVGDLERAGVIVRLRVGRGNHYIVRREERFRHRVQAGVTVGDFVELVEVGNASRRRLPPARVGTGRGIVGAPVPDIEWATQAQRSAQRRYPVPTTRQEYHLPG
jgi:hypothetical protein